jgi:hypothetical protein
MIQAHSGGQGPVIGEIPFILNKTEDNMPVSGIGKGFDTEAIGAKQWPSRHDDVIRGDQKIPAFIQIIRDRIFVAYPQINPIMFETVIEVFKGNIDGMGKIIDL